MNIHSERSATLSPQLNHELVYDILVHLPSLISEPVPSHELVMNFCLHWSVNFICSQRSVTLAAIPSLELEELLPSLISELDQLTKICDTSYNTKPWTGDELLPSLISELHQLTKICNASCNTKRWTGTELLPPLIGESVLAQKDLQHELHYQGKNWPITSASASALNDQWTSAS